MEAPDALANAAADLRRRWRLRSRRVSRGAHSSLALRNGRPHLVVVRERQRPVADDLAGFVALCRPRPERRPACSSLHGRADGARRGRRSRGRPGAPAMISARMAAGSSERGLSSVTMTISALSAAMRPISGRLPRSRSPPQPKTQTSLPRRERAQRIEHMRQAHRACEHSRRCRARRRPRRPVPAAPRHP